MHVRNGPKIIMRKSLPHSEVTATNGNTWIVILRDNIL
jgi:hypothetical protein